MKESGVTFDPYFFSFARFFVAALGLSPFLPAALRDSRVVKAGLELGFWTGAGYLLQSEGLLTTDASRASFLSTFTVGAWVGGLACSWASGSVAVWQLHFASCKCATKVSWPRVACCLCIICTVGP